MASDVLIIDDNDRYGRFRLISWWDQDKIAAAKVMVVGAGALGNEVLKNLALLGVGHVYVVDYDTIEATNLTRSVLYRAADEGKPKCERAAAKVQEMNPDVAVCALNGNVLADVGLGVFGEMNVVVGCLDNREARLWVNRQCWKVGVPWVDGGIQEISGVCKVFVPPASACYECAMTEMDYKLINLKYSCPLLKREEILEGKVPTAPTISSIIAGLQTQEVLKLIHGMDVKAGAAMVFNGVANNFYTTAYPRRENCLSHETYPRERLGGFSRKQKASEILAATKGSTLILERDYLASVTCPPCDVRREIRRPLSTVPLSEGKCPKCRQVMRTEILHAIEADSPLAALTLAELGVPPHDVVRVRTGGDELFVNLDKDRAEALAWRRAK